MSTIEFDLDRIKEFLVEIKELYEDRDGYFSLDESESPTGIVCFTDIDLGITEVVLVGRIKKN